METKFYQRVTARFVRERAAEPFGPDMSGSAKCAALLKGMIADATTERMVVLALDARHRLIGYRTVAVGGMTSCLVEPREVFQVAFLTGAAALVIGHNHPSGSAEPSADDVLLTKRIEEASTIMGIPVLDHVIVGRGGTYSFAERGLMGRAV